MKININKIKANETKLLIRTNISSPVIHRNKIDKMLRICIPEINDEFPIKNK